MAGVRGPGRHSFLFFCSEGAVAKEEEVVISAIASHRIHPSMVGIHIGCHAGAGSKGE